MPLIDAGCGDLYFVDTYIMSKPDCVKIETRAGVDAAWRRDTRSSDIDVHASAQVDWSLKYEQLSGGPFVGEVKHIHLPGLRLVYESMNQAAHQRGSLGSGYFGFAVALESADTAIFSGQKLSKTAVMIGKSEDLDLSTPSDFSLIAVVVERSLLNELWVNMYQKSPSSWLNRQLVVQANPAKIDFLKHAHLSLMRHIESTSSLFDNEQFVIQMRDEILYEWISVIPDKVDVPNLKSLADRRNLVDQACTEMMSHREQLQTILEVCKSVGASPRKLQYCFQDVLGISPKRYLRAIRLNGARRDLKRNADSKTGIADIAARWGFWHAGQFVSLYRQQFGEAPSATLKQ